MAKDELVAPTSRGADNLTDTHLNSIITKYQGKRSRRQSINPFEDRNAPVFQSVLYKLRLEGDRSNPADWLKRDYWVNKVGGVCFYSVTETQPMLYCAQKDLAMAEIEVIDVPPESIYQHVFRVTLELKGDLRPTEFAAESKEAMDFWISQLLAMKAEARAQV